MRLIIKRVRIMIIINNIMIDRIYNVIWLIIIVKIRIIMIINDNNR